MGLVLPFPEMKPPRHREATPRQVNARSQIQNRSHANGATAGFANPAARRAPQGIINMSATAFKPAERPAKPAAPGASQASVIAFPARRRSLLNERNMGRLRAFASVTLPPFITLAIILMIWQIGFGRPGATLPSPLQVWKEAKDLIVDPFFITGPQDIGLGWRVLTSLQRVAVGFGLASVVGILTGALIGQSVWAMRGLDPIFQILRTVPPLAWLPISLAAFRDSQPSAIFVIFITSIWPIIINTSVGIRNIPEDYRNVARVLRLNQIEFFFKIMIPSAAPYIFTGLRIGIGLSWLAIVAAEMLTGGVGIGFFIWDAWNSSRLPDIVVALVYIGVVGFALDRLIGAIGTYAARGAANN
jgi:nitrate/nitrite transport system permease protein